MSSTIWLLLYLAPLLGLTAAVFAWLGWKWRGDDAAKATGTTDNVARLAEAQEIREALEAGSTSAESTAVTATDEINQLREETARELRSLRDELAAAQNATRLSEENAAKSGEAARALEEEASRLLQDLETLRAERNQANADLQAARAELAQLRTQAPTPSIPSESAPEPAQEDVPAVVKPKRKRPTAAKPRTPAKPAGVSLLDKVSSLVGQLAEHQSSVAALTQERDDWQRRVVKLESATPADPAGAALARRSLSDSNERLSTATAEIDRLQNQARVLHQAREQSSALKGESDDLTKIKGIKKVISEQLHAHGIHTWKQIALWNDDELRAFSELLAFKNRAVREKWKEQARALHEAAHGPL